MPNTDTNTPANAGTAPQHTPGPWTQNGTDICGNEAFLADADSGAFSHEECLANARLIAAAPDLLAALEAMLDIARGSEADTMGDDETVAICKGAAELVAKAKGVQS